jgi:DNA polymerase-1
MPVSFPYELIKSADRLPEVAQAISSAPAIGFDIETTSLSPHDGDIRLMQFRCGDKRYVVDLFQTGTAGPIPQAFKDTKGVTIAQQGKFEQKWMAAKHGVEFWPLYDTWRADVILYNGKSEIKHDLYSIYARHGITHTAPDMQRIDWSQPNLPQSAYDYAAEDVEYLDIVRTGQKKLLVESGLNSTALTEFGVIAAEAEVEYNGFHLNSERWLEIAKDNAIKAEALRETLLRELPSPTGQMGLFGAGVWNLDSNEQMLASLQKLGLKAKIRDEETRKVHTILIPDTKEMTLASVASQHPLVEKIIEYRGYSQRVKTFGPEYLSVIHPKTGRIHSEYYPFTGAGRYSCSKPNLQQIPRDKLYRMCFTAQPGKVLILADYSGIEMVIVAEISGDENLIKVFKSNQDAHFATASIIMGKPVDQITKAERQMAKPVNFGFIYGMMPAKLVLYAQSGYGVTMTEAQATEFRRRYFEVYSGISRWHKRALRDGQRARMTRTLGGRLRYLDETAYNEYYNSPVQGTGADALKRSLRLVRERLKKYNGRAKLVHHVHDEIIVEADNDPELIALVKKDLHDGMMEGMTSLVRNVPVKVDPSHGASWAEAK